MENDYQENYDEINCEVCDSPLGYACGDLNCLHLHCNSCWSELEKESKQC